MSGQHARLSASAAHRWLHCPPSVDAAAGRHSASEYAASGTYAHDIAAKVLLGEALAASDFIAQEREVDGFKVLCDTEMVDAVNLYVDHIRDTKQAGDIDHVEMPLLEALKTVDKDFGGTADHVRYRPSTEQLFVRDFKFGSGTYVEVDDNDQLKIYGLGALLNMSSYPIKEIVLEIIQPRYQGAKPIRSWTFSKAQLIDFMAELEEAAAKSRDPSTPRAAGDWCGFCEARRDCPELAKRQQALMANDFSEVTQYDPELLAAALTNIPLVKARIKAIEEFAYAEAVRGATIPGFKLVDKRPTRQWTDEGAIVAWAKEHAVDPYSPPSVLSPAQLEKRLAENAPRGKKKGAIEPIQKFIVGVSNGQTLVPADDNRKEVKKITDSDFAATDGAAEDTKSAVINLF